MSGVQRCAGGTARMLVLLFAGLLLVSLFSPCAASEVQSLTLSRNIGPPTTEVLVSGSGFEPNVGVGICFDTVALILAVTDGNGNFSNALIHVPKDAKPGDHWVTAVERHKDPAAREPFLVRTDWSQFRFADDHSGVNPYEDVVDERRVGQVRLHWTFRS